MSNVIRAGEALRFGARVVQLYDDATMQADHMIDATEAEAILEALADYVERFETRTTQELPTEAEIHQAWATYSQQQRIGKPMVGAFVLSMLERFAPAALEIERLKSALKEANEACASEHRDRELARAELKRRYDAETADGSRWFWQGDGSDHLESMVNGMQVIIGAAELRQLLASAASDSGETREPIYQVRNLDGHWIDTNKRHYEARISRRFTGEARILYAAPAATRDGWKLVPVEPTEAMAKAYLNPSMTSWRQRYIAMLDAAPLPALPETSHTLAGFRGGWIALHGHPPQDQDIWNAGVRSGMDRAAPAATRAQGAVTLTPAMREHLMAGIMALSELQRDNPWIANTKAILAAPAQGASDA